MVDNLNVVILAAGKGKRMKNPEIPKVMVLLDGKPLLSYVVEQVKFLNPKRIIIIVGHKKENVIEQFSYDKSLEFVEQKEQLGTGHAVAQSESLLANSVSLILILCGDVPLLKSKTLSEFIDNHKSKKLDISVLTTIADNPNGYGRIIRDSNGEFLKIVEQKDATPDEQKVNEINSGVYILSSQHLYNSLREIGNSNAQQEYYLTDIVEILHKQNCKVGAFPLASFEELQGINSPEDLQNVENILMNLKNE